MHMRLVTAFVIGFALMMMLWPLIGKGQEHSHPPQDEELHDTFYQTWMRPPMRVTSCCDKKDCYRSAVKFSGGTWFAQRREDLAWIAIPEQLIEQNQSDPRESPDGDSHVCMGPPPYGQVYCFVLGAGI